MKVAFHSNQLCLRGTSVAMFDYAWHNQSMFGNESIIIYERGNKWNRDKAIEHFSRNFKTFGYGSFSEVDQILASEKAAMCYMTKGGEWDGKLPTACKVGVHAVFQNYHPHGQVYAYISEWLSNHMSQGKSPFVPYPVTKVEPTEDWRAKYGIPSGATVFGRHGGADQFDISYVHNVIDRVSARHSNIYFLFMCTNRFCSNRHNVIHIDETESTRDKANFINACHAMIHARKMGESFGLAIAEFLSHDKPVITCSHGNDQNHIFMLGSDGIYYSNEHELENIILSYDKQAMHNTGRYRKIASRFNIDNVMHQFKRVFLDD